MNRTFSLLLAFAVVLIFGCYMMTFTVPYDQMVVVTTFDKVSKTYKGTEDPGLKLKAPWPFQGYHAYPAGLRMVETPIEELPTGDHFNVLLGLSVQWCITDPDLFYRTLESLDKADHELATKTRDIQATVLNQYDFGQLVNADPSKMKLTQVEKDIQTKLNARTKSDYGIEVSQVSVRRLQFAASTNAIVLAGMSAARKGVADELRNQGARKADNIKTQADSVAKSILAFANSRADEIRAQGDAEAAKFYSTFAKDQDFAVFLRQTEAIEKIYGHNTKFLLDSQRGSLEHMLLDGPQAGATAKVKGEQK